MTRCDDQPKDADYYSMLYRLREDPAFIASVAHSLRTRDISAFNPGARPPMTAAKQALLSRTRSDAETAMRDLTETWPADIISSAKLREHLGDDTPAPAAMRHLLDRLGWRKVGRTWTQSGFGPRQSKLYAIRNIEAWKSADPETLRAEMLRGEKLD